LESWEARTSTRPGMGSKNKTARPQSCR